MAGSDAQSGGEVGVDAHIGINLSRIRRRLRPEAARTDVEPFARPGQTAADLGCRTGYYTLALAECVGPEGRVYAVDLNAEAIHTVEEQAAARGLRHIETHASTAADLRFIPSLSVDFVLANGLLCSMPEGRESAVREIHRILKPGGRAYLSLGMPPPIGYVGRAAWERILAGFRVRQRGQGLRVKWALVSAT